MPWNPVTFTGTSSYPAAVASAAKGVCFTPFASSACCICSTAARTAWSPAASLRSPEIRSAAAWAVSASTPASVSAVRALLALIMPTLVDTPAPREPDNPPTSMPCSVSTTNSMSVSTVACVALMPAAIFCLMLSARWLLSPFR